MIFVEDAVSTAAHSDGVARSVQRRTRFGPLQSPNSEGRLCLVRPYSKISIVVLGEPA